MLPPSFLKIESCLQLLFIDLVLLQPYYANHSHINSRTGTSGMPRNTLNYIGLCLFFELLFRSPTWANDDVGISDFALLTGANLTWFDGKQRVSGNISQIISFSEVTPFS